MLELDHIALIVIKEENLKFYGKLGFKEVNRFTRSYDTVVFMQCDGINREIFIDPKHPERIGNPEARGLRHIAITVDDLEKMVKEFECEVISTDFFGTRFTFAKDPDNQPIEFKEKISSESVDDRYIREDKNS